MVRGKQYGYIWAGRLLERQAALSGLPTASAAPPPRLPRSRGRASRAGGGRGCGDSCSPSAPPGRRRSQMLRKMINVGQAQRDSTLHSLQTPLWSSSDTLCCNR
ncbi:uncharacterized protein GJ701_007077 isoform 2-T2 [Geothlypis trichas]